LRPATRARLTCQRRVSRHIGIDWPWGGYWPNGQLDERACNAKYWRMHEASSWIAIIDDDSSVLKALARLLRTRALQAKTFASAWEFLAALPNGVPECLILDLQMPEMSGLELHRHLTRTGMKIPTIFITAYDSVEIRQRCEAAGTAAYLLKPLQDIALFAAIERTRRGTANEPATHSPDA
jgi:FixJ family two-component response regulator